LVLVLVGFGADGEVWGWVVGLVCVGVFGGLRGVCSHRTIGGAPCART
jgi:hypothetical protein